MIITATLNPAVDRTVTLKSLKTGSVNRVVESRQDAGGKGINVSKSIKALGGESKAFALLGGRNGKYIRLSLEELGIPLEVYPIHGETRQNLKIVDLQQDQYTDINEAGPTATEEEQTGAVEAIQALLHKDGILVLSGSTVPGFDPHIYGYLVKQAKIIGAKVILDADGDLLRNALAEGPWLVKPNIHELEAMVGRPLLEIEEVVRVAKEILTQGVCVVVVSMGEDGSLWVDENRVLRVSALKVPVRSTVGAGDAMVAALAVGISQNKDPKEIMAMATLSSTASVMAEGSDSGNPLELVHLLDKIEIQEL